MILDRLKPTFGDGLDLDSVIFLIGVQELGQGYREFKKSEKLDLLHIGICKLMSQFGYYKYQGMDEDGWPHWTPMGKMPNLSPKNQSLLMKEAIIEYFKNADRMN